MDDNFVVVITTFCIAKHMYNEARLRSYHSCEFGSQTELFSKTVSLSG